MDEPMIDPAVPSDGDITPPEDRAPSEVPPYGETSSVAAEAATQGESAQADETPIDYAALAEEDLCELKGLFPELASLRSLTALHDPVRYGELRDLGLSPREAYLATEGGRRGRDNRAHLTGFVPRTTLHTGDSIAPSELAAARELFSGLSDGEIRRLYKRVSG